MPTPFDDLDARVSAALARPLFFVVGAPHSGTTAVQRALDRHPAIRCAGEGHFTDWFGTPLKDLLGAYNARLEANNAALHPGTASHHGFTTGDFRYLLRTAIGLALARLDLPAGTRLVGETTPAYIQRLDVLEALFPTARFLHVVRDGRTAVAAALAAAAEAGGVEAGVLEAGASGLVDMAARQWAADVGKAVVFGASRPDRYHEVRIEDLQAGDGAHMAAVLRFLGVESDGNAGMPVSVPPPPDPHLDGPALAIVLRHQAALLRQFDYL